MGGEDFLVWRNNLLSCSTLQRHMLSTVVTLNSMLMEDTMVRSDILEKSEFNVLSQHVPLGKGILAITASTNSFVKED